MRKTKLAAVWICSVAAASVFPTTARAQWAVDCVNCSTIFTQFLEYAKQAQQYATQLQQYQNQLSMYANMVRNTTALPQMAWAQVQSDINQVRSISNAASLLSGNSGSMISRLNSATSYQLPSLSQYGNQVTMWKTTIGDSLNNLGHALGLQQNQTSNDAALAMAIQAHSPRRPLCRSTKPSLPPLNYKEERLLSTLSAGLCLTTPLTNSCPDQTFRWKEG
jgi:P-type conjugative transfer protein TrbJ